MQIFKRIVFILLIAGLVLYFWQAKKQPPGLEWTEVFARDVPEDNLQFCVDGGRIYFFQPETGRIFVYQTTTRFSRLLTLEKLGKDLKQSRSLSVIEIEKEIEEEEED